MSEIKRVTLVCNGVRTELTVGATAGQYSKTFTAPASSSANLIGGYYPLTLEVEDAAGNITTVDATHATLGASLRLTVKEITKPTISITAPAVNVKTNNNRPAITAQLRDETGGSGINISTFKLKIDSTTYTSTSTGMTVTPVTGGYNISYMPSTALGDGSHTITINVSDKDGNAAISATRSFVVDTVKPTLTVNNPAAGAGPVNKAAYTVNGTVADVTTGVTALTVKVNNSAATAVTPDNAGNWSKTITLTEGTNTILVTATDGAGNTTSVTRTIVLDTVAPIITAIEITPNPVNVGGTVTITITVRDE